MSFVSKKGLLGSAAILSLLAPHAAIAQVDDEIIVTARKQSETIQDVPVTIAVVDGSTLETYQIDEVNDLQSRIPTLNVQVGGTGSGGQISLRGVGSSNLSAAFDSAIAFDFDGITVGTMRMVQAGFFDTQQIEVLKGPQSLYFGKSASGGVISVKSNDPTPEWEAQVNGSYEFEEDGYLIGGYVSGPMSDTVGVRLAAQFNDISAYNKLSTQTTADDLNRGISNLLARGTLQFDPSDRFNANLKVNYLKNENEGFFQNADMSCGADGLPDPIITAGTTILGNHNCEAYDQRYTIADAHPAIGVAGGYPFREEFFDNGTFEPKGETEIISTRLRANLDVSDNLSLASVTGYLDMDAIDSDCAGYVGQTQAGEPGGVGCTDPGNFLKQFSQELRLASDFSGPFNFMIGGFYEDREIIFNGSQMAFNRVIAAGPDSSTGFVTDFYKEHVTNAEALSVFGSVNIDVTDRLELAGGVRYTDESKTNYFIIPYIHESAEAFGNAFLGGFPSPGFNSGDINVDEDNWSPEVSLKYEATDNLNLFAAYKTGFKSGGIDNSALPGPSILPLAGSDPVARAAAVEANTFGAETSQGFEAGLKGRFDEGRLNLNATAYSYTYDDLQIQIFQSLTFFTFNASQARTTGVEADWSWNPEAITNLTLSGTAAYTDAKYTDEFISPTGNDLDGRSLSRAPEWAGSIAADWSTPISNTLELGLNGNLRYSSSYFTDEKSFNDFKQDGFTTIDAAISVANPDAGWELGLAAVNLTDKVWVNASTARPFPGQVDDLALKQNRGRQIFAQVKYKFR